MAWQMLQLTRITQFIEHQLKAIFAYIRNQVFFARRPCWWREQRIYSNSRQLKRHSCTYFIMFSSIVGIKRARYGEDSSRQGFVFTSSSHTWRSSSTMKSQPNSCGLDCKDYLERVLSTERIHLAVHAFYSVSSDFLHLGDDIVHEVAFDVSVVHVQVLLKFCVREFVSIFVFAVSFALLLYRIVRQMYELVRCLHRELLRSSSNIPKILVNASYPSLYQYP